MSGGGVLSRRQWLTTTARYSILGGIGLLVWKIVSRSGQLCLRGGSPCRECQLLAYCRQPKAQEERDEAGIDS